MIRKGGASTGSVAAGLSEATVESQAVSNGTVKHMRRE